MDPPIWWETCQNPGPELGILPPIFTILAELNNNWKKIRVKTPTFFRIDVHANSKRRFAPFLTKRIQSWTCQTALQIVIFYKKSLQNRCFPAQIGVKPPIIPPNLSVWTRLCAAPAFKLGGQTQIGSPIMDFDPPNWKNRGWLAIFSSVGGKISQAEQKLQLHWHFYTLWCSNTRKTVIATVKIGFEPYHSTFINFFIDFPIFLWVWRDFEGKTSSNT